MKLKPSQVYFKEFSMDINYDEEKHSMIIRDLKALADEVDYPNIKREIQNVIKKLEKAENDRIRQK
jgi:hypothetical protein